MKTTPKPFSALWIATCAMFMAMTIILSSFAIPVPGGKLYLCDLPITTAAILLDPLGAALVGGLGTFFGDIIFYPVTMFLSLAVHGIQAAVISWFAHNTFQDKPIIGAVLGVSIGAVIVICGYTFGKIFLYSTLEYAMMKLPFEITQGVMSAAFGIFVTFGCGLRKAFIRLVRRRQTAA